MPICSLSKRSLLPSLTVDIFYLTIQKSNLPGFPRLALEIVDKYQRPIICYILYILYKTLHSIVLFVRWKFHPCLKSILLLTCPAGLPKGRHALSPLAHLFYTACFKIPHHSQWGEIHSEATWRIWIIFNVILNEKWRNFLS